MGKTFDSNTEEELTPSRGIASAIRSAATHLPQEHSFQFLIGLCLGGKIIAVHPFSIKAVSPT